MSTAAEYRRGSRTSSQRNFVTKYIFSQDHKMISKQYLITVLLWELLDCYVYVISFTIAWPEQPFEFLKLS